MQQFRLAVVVLLTAVVMLIVHNCSESVAADATLISLAAQSDGRTVSKLCENQQTAHGTLASGVTGRTFVMKRVRKWPGAEHVATDPSAVRSALRDLRMDGWKAADSIAVMTTIFEPSASVHQLCQHHVRAIVVADKKTPGDKWDAILASCAEMRLITVDMQNALMGIMPFVQHMPWNHFARKNVGYLLAMCLAPTVVWDFDDDNAGSDQLIEQLLQTSNRSEFLAHALEVRAAAADFNPYVLQGAPAFMWPRGFPQTQISNPNSWRTYTVHLPHTFSSTKHFLLQGRLPTQSDRPSNTQVGVMQALANISPDVDAIYRLTRLKEPVNVENVQFSAVSTVELPTEEGVWSPYNAQATLHSAEALWATYLPITVHGRVSDIWRSYIAQAVFARVGLRLAFTPAYVQHNRTAHNFQGDLAAEQPLYTQTEALLRFLRDWDCLASDAGGALLEVYVHLYEHGIVEEDDVRAVTQWVAMLVDMGVYMPKVAHGRLRHATQPAGVRLLDELRKSREGKHLQNVKPALHINFGHKEVVPVWHGIWGSLYREASVYLPGTPPSDCHTALGLPVHCATRDEDGYFAYRSWLHSYEHASSAGAEPVTVMFTHDDAVPSLQVLSGFQASRSTVLMNTPVACGLSGTIENVWFSRPVGKAALARAIQRPGALSGLINRDGQFRACVATMDLFASKVMAHDKTLDHFYDALRTMSSEDAFLEWAVPTAAHATVTNSTTYARLVQSWGTVREDVKLLLQVCLDAMSDSSNIGCHPLKLSQRDRVLAMVVVRDAMVQQWYRHDESRP